MRRFAVLALAGALAVPLSAAAQSPRPQPTQTICVTVGTEGGAFRTPFLLSQSIKAGVIDIVAVDPECDDPEPSPSPSVAPATTTDADGWTRTGQYRYRWRDDYPPVVQVIADKGCRNGLRLEVTDPDGDVFRASSDARLRPGRRISLSIDHPFFTLWDDADVLADRDPLEDDDYDDVTESGTYTLTKVSIRCAPTPWTRTYRGGGSDDRYVTIPANDSIRGRFTARATSSFGCTTGVYVDGESVEPFDLFYDGRQTKTRTGWVDASGRTHLKVISSCPWTLRLTGYRE